MAAAMAMAASAIAYASSTPPSSASSSAAASSSTPSPISRQAWFPNSNPNSNPSSSTASSAHDPSLQFANMMWFKGPYNTQIFVGDTEPADSVVKRFRRAVMQAGVIVECRRRRFFETPQEVAKRKLQAAQRRRSKSRFFPRNMADQKTKKESPVEVEDDDNWEYDGIASGM